MGKRSRIFSNARRNAQRSTRQVNWHNRFEILGAVLLAIASVLTAWSTFQAGKWSGIQSLAIAEAGALRTESTRLSTIDGQEFTIDAVAFMSWLEAELEGFEDTARYHRERSEGPYQEALEEWLATDPLEDPDAVASPLELDTYTEGFFDTAFELADMADDSIGAAEEANRTSDNYMFATVLLAMVLFFSGIAGKFSAPRAQAICLSVASVALVVSAITLVSLPVEL